MSIKPKVQSFFLSVKLGLILVGLGFLIFFVGIILVFSVRIDFPLPILGLPVSFLGFGVIAMAKFKAARAMAEGTAGMVDRAADKIGEMKENPTAFRNSTKPYTQAVGGILHDLMSNVKAPDENNPTPDAKICPKCSHSNEASDKFCGQCGQPL